MFRNLRNPRRKITRMARTNNALCLKIQNYDLVGPRVSEDSPTTPTEGSSKDYTATPAKERFQIGALGRTELHSLMPIKRVVLSWRTESWP